MLKITRHSDEYLIIIHPFCSSCTSVLRLCRSISHSLPRIHFCLLRKETTSCRICSKSPFYVQHRMCWTLAQTRGSRSTLLSFLSNGEILGADIFKCKTECVRFVCSSTSKFKQYGSDDKWEHGDRLQIQSWSGWYAWCLCSTFR